MINQLKRLNILKEFAWDSLNDPGFLEDSVREEIILPILKGLGYGIERPSGLYEAKNFYARSFPSALRPKRSILFQIICSKLMISTHGYSKLRLPPKWIHGGRMNRDYHLRQVVNEKLSELLSYAKSASYGSSPKISEECETSPEVRFVRAV